MKSKRAREAAEADDKPDAAPVDVEAPPKKRKRSSEDDAAADLKKAKKEKKEKKHKKESRKERKEKRKNLQDLPDQDDDDEDQPISKQDAEEDSPMVDVDSKPASATADAAGSDKPSKKDKKKKKRDREAESQQQQGEQDDTSAAAETTEKPKDKKSKKDKNKNKPSDDAASGADADTADPDADAKADRHIVFVGNLPFTATAASIEAHFASLNPVSVRCMSDPKDSKPCRGFAFVEFAKVWHMRTCLDKFHHSMFEDGASPARRINVELTAGGGGKTKQRQEKIKEKNRKLDENRAKRIAREKTAKDEARANGTSGQQQQQQHLEDGIHPSRRARVPGNSW